MHLHLDRTFLDLPSTNAVKKLGSGAVFFFSLVVFIPSMPVSLVNVVVDKCKRSNCHFNISYTPFTSEWEGVD